jgi:hypothetical protein
MIREIGSDMADKELILSAGVRIGAIEIAMLCSLGFTKILCHLPPVVGVMSTGMLCFPYLILLYHCSYTSTIQLYIYIIHIIFTLHYI